MDQLRKAAEELAEVEARASQLRNRRDRLIVEEVEAGVPKARIARSAGISRNMVIRIVNNMKKDPLQAAAKRGSQHVTNHPQSQPEAPHEPPVTSAPNHG